MSELSIYARDWLNDLRRQSGGYPSEVFRHIHAQAEEIDKLKTAMVPLKVYTALLDDRDDWRDMEHKMRAVAEAAKELCKTAYETDSFTTAVDDRVLTALETALAEAGMDMTDEELKANARSA